MALGVVGHLQLHKDAVRHQGQPSAMRPLNSNIAIAETYRKRVCLLAHQRSHGVEVHVLDRLLTDGRHLPISQHQQPDTIRTPALLAPACPDAAWQRALVRPRRRP